MTATTTFKYKRYRTPEGFDDLYMRSDGESLTGLWFARDEEECTEEDVPVFGETSKWLDGYFAGRPPFDHPKMKLEGLTPFRLEVLQTVRTIPYGETMTYGEIAWMISERRGVRMSAQAVGRAVGWNPICILIPGQRVVGADGSLVGYSGGVENKRKLLELERDMR